MNQSDHLEPLLDALDAIQRLLSRFGDRGVIIGGAAVSILGRARFTEDATATERDKYGRRYVVDFIMIRQDKQAEV